MDYKKLDAYRIALTFAADSHAIQGSLPKGSSELTDQLKRATFSIVLNIAEGAGRTQSRDKQRFYSIARGSAMEAGALLDILQTLGLVQNQIFETASNKLGRIVAIMTVLCRSSISGERGEGELQRSRSRARSGGDRADLSRSD